MTEGLFASACIYPDQYLCHRHPIPAVNAPICPSTTVCTYALRITSAHPHSNVFSLSPLNSQSHCDTTHLLSAGHNPADPYVGLWT